MVNFYTKEISRDIDFLDVTISKTIGNFSLPEAVMYEGISTAYQKGIALEQKETWAERAGRQNLEKGLGR